MPAAFLLDAPTLPAGDGAAQSRHPIAKLGSFSDVRYGDFAITADNYADWVRNMAALQGGRLAIDYDHSADRAGGSSKAAGWITALSLQTGAALNASDPGRWDGLDQKASYAVADIEWTPEGAQAVRDRYWLYVSPSIDDHYRDEQDTDHGSALVGVALTNRPFLRQGMPVVSLSLAAEPAFATSCEVGDSPRDMPELTKIANALKLSDDAPEDAILAEITKLEARKPEPVKETKTLEQRAAAEGKVLLTKEEHDGLKSVETRLATVETERKSERFETEYAKTLSEGREKTDDETKTSWRKLYDLDADETVARLSALPKLVNTTARGAGAGAAEAAEVPAGGNDERFELHQRVLARQKTNPDEDYTTALERVQVIA